jgi:hypothetical protein
LEESRVKSFVSLWSADLLDLGRAIDLVAPVANGFHLDVFDGTTSMTFSSGQIWCPR